MEAARKGHLRLITFMPCTTGNSIYAECLVVCRVHSFGHSANNIFTECLQINIRQNNCTRQKTYLPSAGNKTLGLWHTAKPLFPVVMVITGFN